MLSSQYFSVSDVAKWHFLGKENRWTDNSNVNRDTISQMTLNSTLEQICSKLKLVRYLNQSSIELISNKSLFNFSETTISVYLFKKKGSFVFPTVNQSEKCQPTKKQQQPRLIQLEAQTTVRPLFNFPGMMRKCISDPRWLTWFENRMNQKYRKQLILFLSVGQGGKLFAPLPRNTLQKISVFVASFDNIRRTQVADWIRYVLWGSLL